MDRETARRHLQWLLLANGAITLRKHLKRRLQQRDLIWPNPRPLRRVK